MLKKIITLTLSSFCLINSLNAETIYSPAVTVTGGAEEADSLSGSGTYIGSDTIKSNNYDNIDQVLKTIPGVTLKWLKMQTQVWIHKKLVGGYNRRNRHFYLLTGSVNVIG